MCTTCGCGAGPSHPHGPSAPDARAPGHGHGHDPGHEHHPGHGHDPGRARDGGTRARERETAAADREPGDRIRRLERDILAGNDRCAAKNRRWLEERGVVALNLMSAPGSGKTTLLERTVRDLAASTRLFAVEGDPATARDAERIRRAGCEAVQITTGAGCHLEARALGSALSSLDPPAGSLVFVENVGNLVCPALFDLGERARVLIASVTEGEDKPLKYPHIFHAADALVLNKVDLLPHVAFDVARFLDHAHCVNPKLRVFRVSALRGDGLDGWYAWIGELLRDVASPR